MVDKPFRFGDVAQQLCSIRHLEAPLSQRLKRLIVSGVWQVVAQQEVEISVQSAARHLRRVKRLQRTRSSVARICEQRLLVESPLLVERVKRFPRHHNLAPHLKLVGPTAAGKRQRHASYRLHIDRHVVAMHAVASRHGTHQPAVLIRY